MEMIAKGRFFCNQSRRMLHQDGVRCFFAIWRMQRAEQKKQKPPPTEVWTEAKIIQVLSVSNNSSRII